MRCGRRGFGTRLAVTATVLSLGMAACSSPEGQPTASGRVGPEPSPAVVGLRSSAAPTVLLESRDCDAVLEDFQRFAPVPTEVFDGAVLETAGGMTTSDAATRGGETAAQADDLSAGAASGGSSDTNTQEAGIDESDTVETDGDFVYLVDGDRLLVLDGATAQVVGRVALGVHGAQILLQGDRVLAIGGGGHHGAPAALEGSTGDRMASDMAGSFHAGTTISLVDVADRTAPHVVETTEVEGHHVSTRVVDGVARVVVSSYPDVMAMGSGDSASRAAAIEETEIDDWLPSFRTVSAVEGQTGAPVEGTLVECEDVLVPEVNAGVTETSVLRVDFTDGFDPAHTTTVVAEAGTVYASAATLYLAATRYVAPDEQAGIADEDWATAIHAFDLRGDGGARHLGAGEVPGNTLNQYSLSEFDGYLRIATTEGTPWGSGQESESGVRVLQLGSDGLTEVGAVTGLGRTETIQSVRFMGPIGYVVTFRQTDPLYVIDLADPTAPVAVGELKIPGFSSYLHPAGDGRLIGVGRDADEQGRDQGLLVSLFDVSDPEDPRQLQTYVERDAHSPVGFDPRAFLWWAPESVAVLPIERFGPAVSAPEGHEAGITVLDIADGGIRQRATVTQQGRFASRALVVQGRLWSVFDGGVATSTFQDPAAATFHPFG